MVRKTIITVLTLALTFVWAIPAFAGQTSVNGWHEGEEIYYIDLGVEQGITERGENDIYVIAGIPRYYQAHIVEFIPGEQGYSPHWNVKAVFTAEGVTITDIHNAGYASDMYPEVLFDDVNDILAAEDAGLVVIVTPGIVVNCPIISEHGAEAPGHTQASEEFNPIPETFPVPEG